MNATRWPLPRERELLALSVEHNPPRFNRVAGQPLPDRPAHDEHWYSLFNRAARINRLRKNLAVRPDSHSGRAA